MSIFARGLTKWGIVGVFAVDSIIHRKLSSKRCNTISGADLTRAIWSGLDERGRR